MTNLCKSPTSEMCPPLSPRVLSVQSHVVSGYCGNKSATFPLQLLKFEVDVLNTVQFSNHTQYKVAKGQIYKGEEVKVIHEGLKENNILPLYDHVLSGYMAGVDYIEAIADLIKDIKAQRKFSGLSCCYTFDPVLGDDGLGYYVPGGETVAEAYKKHLLPLADVITPNRFEASTLSGQTIDTSSTEAVQQALMAINVFHNIGIRVVVITSLEVSEKEDELMCILSYSPGLNKNGFIEGGDSKAEKWSIRFPKLSCHFTGTGDLFSALLLGNLHDSKFDFKKSLENTANAVQGVLEKTFAWHRQVNDGSVQSRELRLVQNVDCIVNPKKLYEAKKIE